MLAQADELDELDGAHVDSVRVDARHRDGLEKYINLIIHPTALDRVRTGPRGQTR